MAHNNRVNVRELISDEPLDLSMKKRRHEDYVRVPLEVQPNTLQQSKVVMARLWQTDVVIRSQAQPQQVQRFEKAKEKPTRKAQPQKRFRFNHYQISVMERIFEIKKCPTSAEISETARLLNATEYQVRNWFTRNYYKWKKDEARCPTQFVRILPAPSLKSSSSTS